MKQKIMETIGYIFNGFSIALFIYLQSIIKISDSLQYISYVGWILLFAGVVLIVLSIISLVRNKGAGLIDHGVYKLIRHPMYVGAMLCFLSYFFFCPHWSILLISSANIAVIYWFILQGEEQNIIRFGDTYNHYMKNTPRANLLTGIYKYFKNNLIK